MSDGNHNERAPRDAWLSRNPPHPGGMVFRGCLERVEGCYEGMSVSEAARKLGVSRASLSCVLNGRAAITPTLALKLEAQGGGTADAWLTLQARYELAQKRNRVGQWPPDAEATRFRSGRASESEREDSPAE